MLIFYVLDLILLFHHVRVLIILAVHLIMGVVLIYVTVMVRRDIVDNQIFVMREMLVPVLLEVYAV